MAARRGFCKLNPSISLGRDASAPRPETAQPLDCQVLKSEAFSDVLATFLNVIML